MNIESTNFQWGERAEEKRRKILPNVPDNTFRISLSPELSSAAVSAAFFLMMFFNSESNSPLCTSFSWGLILENRKNKVCGE